MKGEPVSRLSLRLEGLGSIVNELHSLQNSLLFYALYYFFLFSFFVSINDNPLFILQTFSIILLA